MKRVEKALYSENQAGALSKMFGYFKHGHNCRKYGSVYCKAKGQVHSYTPVQLASERRVSLRMSTPPCSESVRKLPQSLHRPYLCLRQPIEPLRR